MEKHTLLDLLKGCLKLCGSKKEIEACMDEDVRKFLVKKKTEARKLREQEEIAQKLAAVAKEKEDAEAFALAAEQEAVQAEKEAQRILTESQQMEEDTTEGVDKDLPDDIAEELRKKKEEEALCQHVLEEARENAKKMEAKKAEQEEEIKEKETEEAVVETPPKKKLKRNDSTLLDYDMSPRKKAEIDGEEWNPPMLQEGKHKAPGERWQMESENKVQLLFVLASHLKSRNDLDPQMTFCTIMEFVGAGIENFHERVFIYLVALTLHQKR